MTTQPSFKFWQTSPSLAINLVPAAAIMVVKKTVKVKEKDTDVYRVCATFADGELSPLAPPRATEREAQADLELVMRFLESDAATSQIYSKG